MIGGVIAVVVGGAGFGAYALYGGGAAADDGTRSASDAEAQGEDRGPLSATEVTATARPFLTAWQQGKVPQAAAATDDAAAATALLTGYTKDAHIKDVTLTAGKPHRRQGAVLREGHGVVQGHREAAGVRRAR